MTAATAPNAASSLSTWLDYWSSIHVTAIDLGLERIRPVAVQLGLLSPTAHVVTVAGTNGKGSTTTVIAAIYHAAGETVGLYQSPHITLFNERIRLNGVPVDDARLINAFVQVEAARLACALPLSFFEATTLAAGVVFAQQGCSVWVLEVGLGGRLDAVNLIDPDVAVVTNVGLDHTDWLGDTIEQIAFEKIGITRPHIPVIWGDASQWPDRVQQQVSAHGNTVYRAGRDFHYQMDAEAFYYASPACTARLPIPTLAAVNVANAISAVLAGPIAVSHAQIAQGIVDARIAGRFEVRQYQQRDVILDVAHNVHGMQFLLAQLATWLVAHKSATCNIHLVFSMLEDKDIAGVVAEVAPVVSHWHVAAMTVPRAASLTQLDYVLAPHVHTLYPMLSSALQGAIDCTMPDDLIVVCGSFHVLDAVWEALTHHEHK
jgi:dihydrofolate synthase/folylpolyglutamate synthase